MESTIEAQRLDRRARQELRELQKAARRLESATIERALVQLEELRRDIEIRLLRAGRWDALNLRRLITAVDEATEAYRRIAFGGTERETLEAVRLGWKITEAGAGIIPRAMFTPPEFATFMGFKTDLIRWEAANIRQDVARIVRTALLTGQPLTKAISDIDRIVQPRYAARGERIARTETNRALVLGQTARVQRISDEMPELAGVTKKYWLHTNDDRVRASHEQVGKRTNPKFGGTPISLDESFVVGSESANAPFDPGLSAREVINCRCRLGFVVQPFEGS